jgi:hypothetical protein
MEFHDRNGNARIYSDDGINFYTWGGRPAAYLAGDNVYLYNGRHVGWFSNGCMYGHDGACMLFQQGARGGPLKPLLNLKPLKGLKELLPLKSIRELAPLKPIFGSDWGAAPF